MKILLAEDNRVNRVVAVKMLQDQGHSVTAVENGAEALRQIGEHRYDAVFMDVQMPVMDGLIATAKIREAEVDSGEHLPIIALTANAMDGDRERCLNAGMDGYISKPVHSEELCRALEELCAVADPSIA